MEFAAQCVNPRKWEENPLAMLVGLWVGGIMLPSAIVAWWYSQNFGVAFAAAFAVPMLAIAQGSWGILKYRLYYGEGPHPPAPSHGVVIVNPSEVSPEQQAKIGEAMVDLPRTLGCQCATGCHVSAKCVAFHEKEQPLRLLVIGDSLAIGVGQTKMCSPVMPETIAKTISRELGGRTVYWTCHGAPGASTAWIVRELERGSSCLELEENFEAPLSKNDAMKSWCSDTESSSSEESTEMDETFRNKEETFWRERLTQHKNRFRPEAFGPYDFVVVLTGSNDLKSAFFPFLLTGEDTKFRKEAQKRGGSYTTELNLLLSTLQRQSRTKPLVVLPGLPARALPIFHTLPLRWLSPPIVDILDSHKCNLSKENPQDVVFVPAPRPEHLAAYESKQGPEWNQRCSEKPAMALRDISKTECRRISSAMHEHITHRPPPCRTLPGTNLFASDGIHPTDEGYDFWGRFIANAFLDEYRRIQKSL